MRKSLAVYDTAIFFDAAEFTCANYAKTCYISYYNAELLLVQGTAAFTVGYIYREM